VVGAHHDALKKGEDYTQARPTRLLALLGYDEFPGDERILRRVVLADRETGELYDESVAMVLCELRKHRARRRAKPDEPILSPDADALLDFLNAEDERSLENAARTYR
jgi:hypothetical protein